MKRAAKLLFPLGASLTFAAVYFFISANDLFGDATIVERNTVLKAILFVGSLAAVAFLVRLIDFAAFEVFPSRRGQVAAPGLLREIVALVLYSVFFVGALWYIF